MSALDSIFQQIKQSRVGIIGTFKTYTPQLDTNEVGKAEAELAALRAVAKAAIAVLSDWELYGSNSTQLMRKLAAAVNQYAEELGRGE